MVDLNRQGVGRANFKKEKETPEKEVEGQLMEAEVMKTEEVLKTLNQACRYHNIQRYYAALICGQKSLRSFEAPWV